VASSSAVDPSAALKSTYAVHDHERWLQGRLISVINGNLTGDLDVELALNEPLDVGVALTGVIDVEGGTDGL